MICMITQAGQVMRSHSNAMNDVATCRYHKFTDTDNFVPAGICTMWVARDATLRRSGHIGSRRARCTHLVAVLILSLVLPVLGVRLMVRLSPGTGSCR